MIEEYSGASWITNEEGHSSSSGWIFLLGEIPFYGLSKNRLALHPPQ